MKDNPPQAALLIGIDWADQEHEVYVLDRQGKGSRETIQQTPEAIDAWAGKKGGVLWAVSSADGKKVSEYTLDAPPVFDGMAAANGKLFLATTDGTVVCLKGN